jgi:SAM-dependent methyltransferase
MVDADLLAFVRTQLPPPPARVLEIGAGSGDLARALAAAGYDVCAIDPEPAGAGVRAVALRDLDAPSASFAGAVAVTSLHHVEPLAESLQRLAEVLEPGGVLVIDEFDVGAFDRRAAGWWLRQQRARGAAELRGADELVEEHRAHLHPLDRIVARLKTNFDTTSPRYGPYLYRWDLDESVRPEEEEAIARGEIPPVGARLVARRTTFKGSSARSERSRES